MGKIYEMYKNCNIYTSSLFLCATSNPLLIIFLPSSIFFPNFDPQVTCKVKRMHSWTVSETCIITRISYYSQSSLAIGQNFLWCMEFWPDELREICQIDLTSKNRKSKFSRPDLECKYVHCIYLLQSKQHMLTLELFT